MPVTVRLKNPPSGGNYWRLVLFNEVWGESLTVGQHIPVDQPITLESLPAGWSFPLYIDIFIYENPVSPYNVVYEVQSAYGPDWPFYRDVTIPDYGDYTYNVATEQFEPIEVELWTSIEIVAPSSARAGTRIGIIVKVRNVDPIYMHYIATSCAAPYKGEGIIYEEEWIAPGGTVSYQGLFTMPNEDAGIYVSTWRWDIDHWVLDNYAEAVVALEVAPPVAGTITKKELDYQDRWQAIPIYDIPFDTRVRVRITGRNDTDVNQKMGISWIVSDPDGMVVDEYSKWETLTTAPGDEQEFVGGGFDLSKIGTYILEVGLYMTRDNPVLVDWDKGTLCTVAVAVPEPEFRGFALSEYTK